MRLVVATLCVWAWLSAAPAVAKELVVIAANNAGPTLTPGKALQNNQKIRVPEGGRITVLARSGEVIKLKGPYTGAITAKKGSPGSRSLASVSRLLSAAGKASVRLGATRGGSSLTALPTAAPPTDPWLIFADRSGIACWHPAKSKLWRANPGKPAAISISILDRAPKALIWPTGQRDLIISKELITNGGTMKVVSGGKSTTLRLKAVPANIATGQPGGALQWMAASGCKAQSRRLIRVLHGD